MQNVSAMFEVETAFEIASRHAVVIGGKILSGVVKAGMRQE
ncbi:MAG TPA: hypothetical protein VK737_12100 [Opitutales bacterium]|jgi:hypothetical protein|nr:hypothetical protein [Opitutales bacterium]